MRVMPRRRLIALIVATATATACGGAGVPAELQTVSPTAAPTASPVPTAAPTVAASPAAGSLTFTVASGSKAIVRVTEQLADQKDLSDAVLTSDNVTGEFTLQPDGTFASSSKIVVDLNALSSDSSLRDGTVKRSVLETSRFPQATFVPVSTEGLTLPLPASGDLSFKLTGQMSVHGLTKSVVFDVKAKRSGGDLTATATVAPAFQFATFGMTQPRVFTVLSIKDEIRLEVQLVATQK
jgi:polyisoprenoid-binding protein YceI